MELLVESVVFVRALEAQSRVQLESTIQPPWIEMPLGVSVRERVSSYVPGAT